MCALEWAVYQRCFPDRGSTCESALTSCKTSVPPPLLPSTVHISLFSSKDLAHVCSERQDNDSHIYVTIRTDPGRAQVPRHSRPLDVLQATPCQTPAPHAPSLQTAWTSPQNFKVRSTTSRKFSTASSQHPRQQPGSRSSNGAFLFGKNNNSSRRIARTFRLRHPSCSLTVRISLQRPTFETIPLLRTPELVKSEHPPGSSPSPSGYAWN